MAVLAALVAAMFVALQSVSAAGCVANPGITLGLGESCEVSHDDATDVEITESDPVTDGQTVLTAPATLVDGSVVAGSYTITADALGTATVSLWNYGRDGTKDDDDTGVDANVMLAEYDVEIAGFAIRSLAVKDDSDNVVSAGPQITVVATLRSALPTSSVRLTVPTTGLSIETNSQTGATSQSFADTPGGTGAGATRMVEFMVNTAGAPEGEYSLTFTADQDGQFDTKDGTTEGNKQATQSLTLRIGDPGTGLASATLSLGNSSEDKPFTDANEAVAETGSDAAKGGSINLVVEAFDSLGGKANSGSLNQIIVIAPQGSVTSTHLTGNGTDTAKGDSSATLDEKDANTDDAVDPSTVGQKTVITVWKTDEKPGQVTVYAIVSGPGGAARTGDVTLSFSGPAASMSIADATESLLSVNVDADDDEVIDEDTIKLLVTAEDSGGNATAPPTSGVSIVITDPDGKRQGTSVIGRSQPTKGTDGKHYITLNGKGSDTAPLAAGNWTLTAKSGTLEAEATFAVAGAPNDVAVSASETSSDTIGDVITITASVTDKDGNTVSDGTSVMFDVSEDTGLAAIGTGHAGKATKNGEASVKYAVVSAGHSVVSATAGGATGVIVIDSTAGATDMAMPEEEASVACLSNLAGFSTWSCGVETSASEIFGFVSGRGATALHLWNGSAWVRYSVVDGTMVPGSSDFMVAENDILYISN